MSQELANQLQSAIKGLQEELVRKNKTIEALQKQINKLTSSDSTKLCKLVQKKGNA